MKKLKYLLGSMTVLALLTGCQATKTIKELPEEAKLEETKGTEKVTLTEDCKYDFTAREEGKEFWTETPENCIVSVSEGELSLAFAKNQLVATFEDVEKLQDIEKFFEGKGYVVTGLVGLDANQSKEMQLTSSEDKTYDELLSDVMKLQEEGKDLIKSVSLNILASDNGETK